MTESTLKHHFLIAMPGLIDLNFSRAVVYIYEHTSEGAMGLVINKPLNITLGNVLKHLKIEGTANDVENLPVLLGGPIGQDHGFVLHDDLSITDDDQIINKEIVLSGSKDVLESIAIGQGPKNFLIALGYSGWGAAQLEREMGRNDWLLAPFNSKILFETPIEERWFEAAKLIGVDMNSLSDQVGHA